MAGFSQYARGIDCPTCVELGRTCQPSLAGTANGIPVSNPVTVGDSCGSVYEFCIAGFCCYWNPSISWSLDVGTTSAAWSGMPSGNNTYCVSVTPGTDPGTIKLKASVTPNCSFCNTGTTPLEFVIQVVDAGGCTGCSEGDAQSNALGSAKVTNHSGPNVRFRLGRAATDYDAGFLWLRAATPAASLGTPAALALPFRRSQVDVVTNANGVIEQVCSPQGLLNVVASNGYAYIVHSLLSDKCHSQKQWPIWHQCPGVRDLERL